MAVTIMLLGRLADLGGADEITLEAPLDWAGLLAGLSPELAEAVAEARVRMALNGALVTDKTTLQAGEGDEVALLPPVSGG